MRIKDLRDDLTAWPILEARARVLAGQAVVAAPMLADEMLIFQLGEARYGLPALSIRGVQPLGSWTALPSTPPFIVGLVNVRGRLLTALDLRPLLDLPAVPPVPTAQLIVLAASGGDIGLLADAAITVERVDRMLMPTPCAAAGHAVAWVRGVDRDMHILLDPAALLADPRLIVNAALP